jgi:hypothetical protein
MILALATQNNMHCDHLDDDDDLLLFFTIISQAFVQGDLLPGDGYNGKVYISVPPGYDEDPNYVWQLRRPLYGMPSAARAWHNTMSAHLKSQGCKLVGFERSMWTVVKEGRVILITAHIDDFIIACDDRKVLNEFRTSLMQRFEGTYEGKVLASVLTPTWGVKFCESSKQAKHFCRRNIMRKTYYTPTTIGIVFRPLLL